MDTIHIAPGAEGRLIVRLPYSEARVAKIKTIPGRRWHHAEKYWTVPNAAGMPERLLTLFAGEKVELAPALRSTGEAVPIPQSAPSGLLNKLRDAVRTRHLSPSTERAYVAWAERFLSRQGAAPSETLGEAF